MHRKSCSCDLFTYSPLLDGQPRARRHVLFRDGKTRWTVVNDTGLEIARALARDRSVNEIAGELARRFDAEPSAIRADVVAFRDRLRESGLLGPAAGDILPRSPALTSLYLHLTERCNLACPSCYMGCAPRGANVQEMEAPRVLQLIDELAEAGGEAITLSGGEPLLYPEIRNVLTAAARRLRVRLLTNGTRIDREAAAFLADLGVGVQISIDGPDAAIHDRIRGPGAFARSLRGLRLLQEAGLNDRLNLCTTVMGLNIAHLDGVVDLAERLGVPLVRFVPVRKTGTAEQRWSEVGAGIGPDRYGAFFQRMVERLLDKSAPVRVSYGLSGFLLEVPEPLAADGIWCPVGREVVVDTDGCAYPCVLLMHPEFRLGNVYETDLLTLMRSRPMAEACEALRMRSLRIPRYTACTWRTLCQAGCMGQALEHRGTVWEVDDHCALRQTAYERAFRRLLEEADG